jgi:hypothetical protein
MSNFLANLFNRSLGKALAIKPRLSSFFETTLQGMSVDRPPLWEESEREVLQSPMEEPAAVAPGAPRRRTPDPMSADGRREASAETPLPYEEEQAANPGTRQVTPGSKAIAASSERPPARVEQPGKHRLRPPFAVADELETRSPVEHAFDPPQTFPASDESIPAPHVPTESDSVPTQRKRAAWAQQPESIIAQETHRDPILFMARSAERWEDRSIPHVAAHAPPALASVFLPLKDLRFKSPRREESPPSAAAEPTVQVTIGRLEVRAVAAPANTSNSLRSSPVMSLSEYLRSKRGGG